MEAQERVLGTKDPFSKDKHKIIHKFIQNNGEYLIVTQRSLLKERNRYFYEGYFEGYNKKLIFRLEQAQKGQVWNPDKPDKYGFVTGTHHVDKYIYNIWKNMERRCYYTEHLSYKDYGAKGIRVSNEFKNYSIFEKWYKLNWDGYSMLELDKDVKSLGKCKMYSPMTCILIPNSINTFISTLGGTKGIERVHNKINDTFCLHYRRKYKKLNKNFKTLKEAKEFKRKLDIEYLETLLQKYTLSDDIKEALRNYVKVFI